MVDLLMLNVAILIKNYKQLLKKIDLMLIILYM
jgi:hypothetical protein